MKASNEGLGNPIKDRSNSVQKNKRKKVLEGEHLEKGRKAALNSNNGNENTQVQT